MKDLSYFPKTDIRFWQNAVFRQPYIIDGQGSAKPFVDVDSPMVGGYNERYTFVDPPIPSEFYAGSVYIGKAFNLETDWQNTFQITSKNTAVAGATYYLEAGHDNSFAQQEENNFALYLQDLWEIIPNLTLTAGGRWDHYQLAGNAFTYRFSGAYLIDATKTKLRASYGTAFKAPDLFDTFSTAAFCVGKSWSKTGDIPGL